ncbi:hypothetical protein OIDMADRAFT_149914 [Oidiodendron maius Zn]|uniref:WW domain-containing protein n=1 Tax=Oidiodendron maius (strain Zn) TaxID=913774 RepID=A0A0C3GMT5_OIDMZ|nr:hypothetical protein OIDMADRAFT_149914 [Oidiodendron maius Zn]
MAPTIKTSNQNSSNQPAAPPRRDQLDQSLVPQASDIEQAEQPPIIEHKKAVVNISGLEEAVVIVTPGNSIIITDEMRDEMRAQLKRAKHAGESIPSDWDKPEAWTQDTDIEGQTVWYNEFTTEMYYSRPECLSAQNESRSTAKRHEKPDLSIMEQEEAVIIARGQKEIWAIGTPGNGLKPTVQMNADLERARFLSRYGSLTSESKKPEAWVQEKDIEGKTIWCNQITGEFHYSRPECLSAQDESRSTAKRHKNPNLIPENKGRL